MEGLLGRGAFLVTLGISLLVASAAAVSSSRPRACPGAARPVCGKDGFTYFNPCVAAYNGVSLAGYGACPGDPQRFVPAIVGPLAPPQRQPPPQQQRGAAAAPPPPLLLPDILDAYKQQGFAYIGRVAMSGQPGMGRQANPPPPASAAALGAAAWFESQRPRGLWAARCTSAGDVYVARYAPPSEAMSQPRSSGIRVVVTEELAAPLTQQPPAQQQRTDRKPRRTPVAGQAAAEDGAPPASSRLATALRGIWQQPSPPPSRAGSAMPSSPARRQGSPGAAPSTTTTTTTTTSSSSSSSRANPPQARPAPAAPAPLPRPRRPPRTRRLSTLLGGDQRAPCSGVPPAVGMLRFSLASTQYVCTGVLFAPRKVLTAGHCVYDSDTNTYVSGLTFTPGQALAPNGTWLAPFGVLPASAVTVFKNYLSTNTSAAGDLAVVHLNDTDLASRVGVMPLSSSGCGGGPRPLALTTAGYPVDKPLGSCWEDGCGVTLDCASGVSRHTCDTALGQSGSPLWDGQGRVRAVHVRGDDTYNEAITLTEPVVQAINSW